MRGERYAIVTAVRNEVAFLGETLASVAKQTVTPLLWVLVDDGSEDGTTRLIEQFVATHPFAIMLRLEQPERHVDRLGWGAGTIAVNRGLGLVDLESCEYVVKLDGDLRLPPDYFERLFEEFESDPRLGIAGGHCYEERGGRLVLEWVPDSHVRGATKVYRKTCFRDIGGLQETYGWDTIDEIRAQMHGWRTRSFREPGVVHLRPSCRAYGRVRGMQRWGYGAYRLGYHPLFALARAARLATRRPVGIGGAAFVFGFMRAWLTRVPLVVDAGFVRFLRRRQLERLRLLPAQTCPTPVAAEGSGGAGSSSTR